MTVKTVGIDAMAFHGPGSYLDMVDLALARGVEPAKYVKGLGQTAMAVPTPCEDTVSLAISAGRKALQNFDIDLLEDRHARRGHRDRGRLQQAGGDLTSTNTSVCPATVAASRPSTPASEDSPA